MDEPATLSLLTKRADFIAELSQRPLEKREMVDVLGYSRATVNRAIRDLEEARLVKPVDGGYTPTLAAREALETYEQFLDTEQSILDATDIVYPLNHEAELPSAALIGAEVFAAGQGSMEGNAARLGDAIEAAESARLLVPSEEGLLLLEQWQDSLNPGEQRVEVLLDAELYATVRTTRQSLASLAAAGGKVATVDSPEFFLAFLDTGDTQVVFALIYDPDVEEFGVIRNESAAAIDWATRYLDRLDAASTRVDDELETSFLNDRVDIPNEQGAIESVPQVLAAEGFTTLSEQYFDSHESRPLNTALRTGLSLADVRDGHATERVTADGELLSEQILRTLQRGQDCTVTGQPGSGKSTLCKLVAHKWDDRDLGAVIYRESGRGAPFESVASLRSYLQRVGRTVLVVVEDAMRPEANKVFELAQELDGWDGVHFLFDARTSEWTETRKLPVDAALREYQQQHVDEIDLESPGEGECQAFLEKYQDTTGEEIQTTGEELAQDVTRGRADSGGMFLLSHIVCVRADPVVADDAVTPTRLVEDVQTRLNALVTDGSTPVIRAAILSQFLNVAEIPLHEAFFDAISHDTQETVDVVSPLKTHGLIFEAEDQGTFRAPHNRWAKQFVEEALDVLPDAPAQFGAAVNSVLRLGHDDSFRAAVTAGRDSPLVQRLDADATTWADGFVQGLFQVGEEINLFAPYYGRFDDPTFDIQECCSLDVVYECGHRRAKILGRSGEMAASLDEYQTIIGHIYRASNADQFKTELANCFAGVGTRLRYQGRYDAAEAHVQYALALHHEQGNRERVGSCLLSLGMIANYRSQYEEAAQYYEGARDAFAETNSRKRLSNALGNLAVSHADRANYDEAEQYAEESLEIRREIGFDLGIAQCYNLLARAVISRGAYQQGFDYHRDCLAIATDLGNPEWECTALSNLGSTCLLLGRLDDSVQYLRRGLDVFEDRDDADTRYNLARALRRQGEYAAAKEHAESGLERATEVGDRRGTARCRHVLGEIASSTQDYERGREHFTAALSLFQELGLDGPEITSRTALGRVEIDAGNLDTVRAHINEARERLEAADSVRDERAVRVLRLRAALASAAGEWDKARRLFDEAAQAAVGLSDRYARARGLIDAGRFAVSHGDELTGIENLRTGLRIARDIGATPLQQDATNTLERLEATPVEE